MSILFKSLLDNVFLLFVLVFLFGLIKRSSFKNVKLEQLSEAILFSLIAFIVMLVPFEPVKGIFLDTRGAVVICSGLYAGPIVAFLTVLTTGIYRAYLGGAGMIPGLAGIVLDGVSGYIFYMLWRSKISRLKFSHFFLLGGVTVAIELFVALVFFGYTMFTKVLLPMTPTVIPVYAASTIVLGLLLQKEHIHRELFVENGRIAKYRARLLKSISSYNQDLKRLLYIAAHDFKCPLLNIEGYSNVLIEEVDSFIELVGKNEMTSEVRLERDRLLRELPEIYSYVRKGTTDLEVSFDGLLKLSRVAGAHITKTKLDTNLILSEILDTLKPDIKVAGAKVETELLPHIYGDEILFKASLTNLISNALKYAPADRDCIIKIHADEKGDQITYKVTDNGNGISEIDQTKVFDMFYRCDGSGEKQGHGLGLPIAKWATLRLGGEMDLISSPNQGSTFSMSFSKDDVMVTRIS
jgi:signal transduction histidine kinase